MRRNDTARRSKVGSGLAIVVAMLSTSVVDAGAVNPTHADLLAPKGARARLDYTVTIDGQAEFKGPIGEFDTWRTHRTLTASVELVADKPSKTSPIDAVSANQAATAKMPSDDMLALQREAQACGTDQACMTRVAQKMMAAPETQAAIAQSETAERLPVRYQSWRPARDKRPVVKATIETHTEGVFKTATTEHKTCSQYAELGADKLFASGVVFVDGETGIGHLGGVLSTAYPVPVETKCVLDMGGTVSKTVDQQAGDFFPKGTDPTRSYPGEPVAEGNVIAQGRIDVNGSYGDLSGVPMNAKVVVRWALTRL